MIYWNASVSSNWIRLSQNSGSLSCGIGNNQMRIWVDIDWTKFPNEKGNGNIIFNSGDKKVKLNVQAAKINQPGLSAYNGFIENNGFVSMEASHFSRQTNRPSNQWKLINGLGYTGTALEALPLSVNSKTLTNPDSVRGKNAFVEYDFYTFSSATPSVIVFALPTHSINNNYGVRYAVSIDDGPLKLVDIKTFGRSEEWKQNVLRNRAERKIEMPFLKSGKHTLKMYYIDPGVILDEIRIDLGGLKKAYSSLPETKIKQ